jgi:hypothetical protein
MRRFRASAEAPPGAGNAESLPRVGGGVAGALRYGLARLRQRRAVREEGRSCRGGSRAGAGNVARTAAAMSGATFSGLRAENVARVAEERVNATFSGFRGSAAACDALLNARR